MTFEPIDHTADIGFELKAPSLEALYAQAAATLTDAITEARRVRPRESFEVRLTAADRELLMVEWLEELVFRFDTDSFLAARAEVRLEERAGEVALEATVRGERFDPERHPVKVAIKGVTYHGLEVRPEGEGWRARVIFDI